MGLIDSVQRYIIECAIVTAFSDEGIKNGFGKDNACSERTAIECECKQKENIANYSCSQYNHYIDIMRGNENVMIRMRGLNI